jgi:hypothetical protein
MKSSGRVRVRHKSSSMRGQIVASSLREFAPARCVPQQGLFCWVLDEASA